MQLSGFLQFVICFPDTLFHVKARCTFADMKFVGEENENKYDTIHRLMISLKLKIVKFVIFISLPFD